MNTSVIQSALNELKKDFPNIEHEAREYYPYIPSPDGTKHIRSESPIHRHTITKIDSTDNLSLSIDTQEDIDRLRDLLSKKVKIYKDFIGLELDNRIEVLLRQVSRLSYQRVRELESKSINIKIHYKGCQLSVSIGAINKTSPLKYLTDIMGPGPTPRISLTITKPEETTLPISEAQTRQLIFSILFDIEYSYELSLDAVKYDGPTTRGLIRRSYRTELPDTEINLIFKNYTPELIEYFHTAEKVDYLPFKYICYFHIIEYFMDKSAYRVASKRIKELLFKPDFHIRSNHYIAEAINIFKKENERNQTDAIKINRVLKEFVQPQEIQDFISNSPSDKHFKSELKLSSQKTLTLPAIKFDSDNEFYSTLSKRIYMLRCSIVHSNPDFDEDKAIPFAPTEENLMKLRKEILLIKQIAKTIVAGSAE